MCQFVSRILIQVQSCPKDRNPTKRSKPLNKSTTSKQFRSLTHKKPLSRSPRRCPSKVGDRWNISSEDFVLLSNLDSSCNIFSSRVCYNLIRYGVLISNSTGEWGRRRPGQNLEKSEFIFYFGIGLYSFCWFKNYFHWKCKGSIQVKEEIINIRPRGTRLPKSAEFS